ncbi:hypothetical protein AB0F15_19975 [Amycolatopsis sp. NPDC026612]|uniref:hypothetical protein n=1 Tax=Amycolatopsis sp. NPDC026612 TaxID=3155466 RepID=UPI0033D74BEF
MTYPPQPGQPGQPDPYGQPQSGGYPQQGGWDPNQQQPYPTQQYPQGWDPNQQQGYPPPSGGFPANPQPAWGDPYAQQQWADPTTQQYGQQQSAWADPNAQQYGQQTWDPNAGGQVSGWAPAAGGYAQGFGGPPAPPKKSRTGMWVAIGSAVVVVLALVGITGFVAPGFFLSKDDNTAAAPASSTSAKPSAPKTTSRKSTTRATEPPAAGGGNSDAKAVLQGFIDKLNAGDNNGAVAMGCADSKDLLSSWLDTFLKPPLQLQLGEVPADKYLVSGEVTGTAAGKPVKGTLSATNFDKKGFCVSTMLVS